MSELSLVRIYDAFGFIKVFRTQKAKEQIPWARDRSERFIRFIDVSELLGTLGIVLAAITGDFPWLAVFAAIGFSLIQIPVIFKGHLPKKDYKVLPFNITFLSFSMFTLVSHL